MGKGEPKAKQEKSGIVHEEKCTGCGISPIVGIRYKCIKCPSFNFCEACQATISHDHNMIKMKYLEEPEKVQQEFGWKGYHGHHGWWKKNSFQRHPCRLDGGFSSPKREEPKEESDPKAVVEETDSNLKLTRKCFRMAKFFGGKPENFREFVSKNVDMKFN